MPKKLLFCTHKVNKSNIRRENRKGVEHVILTSYTLPPDIVMNGGLYPSSEIDKSFQSLNRTPVTVEHPEIDGMFVSANDPEIDFDFRFGAFNENARKLNDGRVALDKVINVQKALKTDKGKRLLDRIEELETNGNARPIHTSVGVFIDIEEVELTTNERGQEYTWIAKDMIFDHDAILLDSVGASTPDQGTGIGINKEQLKVSHFIVDTARDVKAKNCITNSSLSFTDIEQALYTKINDGLTQDFNWVQSVYNNYFIYDVKGDLFKSYYIIDEHDNLEIQDTRIPVERVVEYKTITSTDINKDNAMRDQIIAELTQLGITVNTDISETELMAKYKEALIANTAGSDDDAGKEDLAVIVANAVKAATKPLSDQVNELKANIVANTETKLTELSEFIVNSNKYPDLTVDDIKGLGIEKVRAMASNCGTSHSISNTMQFNQTNSDTLKTNVSDLPD